MTATIDIDRRVDPEADSELVVAPRPGLVTPPDVRRREPEAPVDLKAAAAGARPRTATRVVDRPRRGSGLRSALALAACVASAAWFSPSTSAPEALPSEMTPRSAPMTAQAVAGSERTTCGGASILSRCGCSHLDLLLTPFAAACPPSNRPGR